MSSAISPGAKSVEITIIDQNNKKLIYRFGSHKKGARPLDVELNYEVNNEYSDAYMDLTPIAYLTDSRREFTLKVRN